MTGKQIIRSLLAAGWEVLRQEGSHVRLARGSARVTVPSHGAKDLKPKTVASIERQTGVRFK